MIRKILAFTILVVLPCAAPAQGDDDEGQSGPVTLQNLAAGADYIGVLQVDDRDYETTRDMPTAGVAFLRPLISYRHPGDPRRPPELVEVHENGVGAGRCYYPERQNEGHRFLAFLHQRPEGEGYTGRMPGCMLPVYVTADNRYALRFPVEGLEIPDRSLVREIHFADPDAFVDRGEDLSYARSRELEERGLVRADDSGRRFYTHGIYLEDLSDVLRSPGSETGSPSNSE